MNKFNYKKLLILIILLKKFNSSNFFNKYSVGSLTGISSYFIYNIINKKKNESKYYDYDSNLSIKNKDKNILTDTFSENTPVNDFGKNTTNTLIYKNNNNYYTEPRSNHLILKEEEIKKRYYNNKYPILSKLITGKLT